MASSLKRLITGSGPLCCHGGIRDVLPLRLLRGRRLFHQPSRQPRRREYEQDWQHHLHNARPLLTAAQAGRVIRSPRTHVFFGGCAVAAAIFYVCNLETVPVSGRRRFNCYGDGDSSLSDQQVKRVIYETERQGLRILPEHDLRYGDTSDSKGIVDSPLGR